VALDSRGPGAGGGEHPDAEQLAEYTDGVLTGDARAQIEAHLADCADCRDVVTDTRAFVIEDGEPIAVDGGSGRVLTFPTRWVVVGAGLAAAAAVVLAVYLRPANNVGPAVADLIAAYASEPVRLAEGRISGFDYAPAPALTRGTGDTGLSPDVKIAAAGIETAAGTERSVQALWALGIARLALRDTDGAVSSLESATGSGSAAAELHSDLAAAYLARARVNGNAGDRQRALAAADHALEMVPDLPAALFNRALALDALASGAAQQAWQAVMAREPDSAWAREAAVRVAPAP